MTKIRLTVEPTDGKSKLVDPPADWSDMDSAERQEFLAEEAADFALTEVKYHGKVVE